MSTWTINDVVLADGLMSNVVRSMQSQGTDTVTFEMAMADATDDFMVEFGDGVSIKKDGVAWFQGACTKPEVSVQGGDESHHFEISGPWYFFENLTFQQSWKVLNPLAGTMGEPDTITIFRSRYVLGQASDGARMTAGAVISEILSYAMDCGVTLTIGSIATGPYVPFREEKGLTCAAAIRRMMTLMPDAVFSFDYSTSPPTVNVIKRSDAAAVTLPAFGSNGEGFEIAPCHELQVGAVVLRFESRNTYNDAVYMTLSEDKVPSDATGQELRAIVEDIDLNGQTVQLQLQPVQAVPIPDEDSDASVLMTWWKRRFTQLRNVSIDNLNWVLTSWYSVLDDGQTNDDGTPITFTVGDVPRELVSGQIAPWMKAEDVSLKGARMSLGIQLFWSPVVTPADGELDAVARVFGGYGPDYAQWFWKRIIATNAVTQTYTQITSFIAGETAPTGIATYLYNALNALQFRGRIATAAAELAGTAGIGKVLNLSGGRAAWSTMNAQIQSVSESVDDGKTSVSFGPAPTFSLSDLMELLRSNRMQTLTDRFSGRATGQA